MTDFIDRDAALSIPISHAFDNFGEIMISMKEVVAGLEAIPAADVAPVVHCKDCRNCYKEDEYTLWCQGRGSPAQLVPPDGFCDRGART